MPTAPNHGTEAFALLLQGHEYARTLKRSPWDFAVNIKELRAAKLHDNDLRWLLLSGYVEHARETTRLGSGKRAFRRSGTAFTNRSCFILTEQGKAVALLAQAADMGSTAELATGLRALRPRWDGGLREFRLGPVVVKRFEEAAPNQELLLGAFEEQDFSQHIDDPIPPESGLLSRERLRDTVKRLNRSLRGWPIRFHVEHGGKGVRWELLI
jgi:hypothetical protein